MRKPNSDGSAEHPRIGQVHQPESFLDGKVILHPGDCLAAMKLLPSDSVDSIASDPPYGLGKEPDPVAMLRAWLEGGHYDIPSKSGFMGRLVRLVTPPGGLVLDPFAGTGTTGEAAFREGMRAILIEREPEYQNDIRRRMAHAMAGPEERKRTIAKIKNPNPVNDGLFALLPSNLAETPEISPNTKAGLSQ